MIGVSHGRPGCGMVRDSELSFAIVPSRDRDTQGDADDSESPTGGRPRQLT